MSLKRSKSHIKEEIKCRKGCRGISSSGFNTIPPSLSCIHQQIQIQPKSSYYPQNKIQNLTHLQNQIPSTSPRSPEPHFHFYHEQPISKFRQRPIIMALASPSLPYFPILSSLKSKFITNALPSTYSFETLVCKLCVQLSHARLVCAHLRFLVLLSFSSLYFFLFNRNGFFILSLVSILAFSFTLLLNLRLSRLPSIRLPLSHSLLDKIRSARLAFKASRKSEPIVWSIGSNPETLKKLNSGCWVQVYSNGDVYEGEFHRGKCSGSGVYYYMSGRYEGDWIDGKYDGYGVETWTKGSRYRGQYRQGLRHGIGVYRFCAGDVYTGEWSNGQCHGCGIRTCDDGSKYVGEFKWGVKHGFGCYLFRNGDTYAGEYFADKMHGFGVYQFGNGHRYEGAWHDGRRQGLGVYTFRNGETQSGHWQNGILGVPSVENNSLSGCPYSVSHSKVLEAVQEARRASQKAHEMGMVDERVNKAVGVANKAANAARVAAVKAVQRKWHHRNNIDDALISLF